MSALPMIPEPISTSIPLCLINIVLVPDFLDTNLHAVLAKTDILLLHLLRRLLGYIRSDCVYRIADGRSDGEDDEEDDERDNF